jgi:bacterioferritin
MAKKAAAKGSPLIDTLNDLRARELAVIMQYMRHHYQITGPDGLPLAGEFKEIAIVEMKHAEELAERIDFLGGDPTTKPWQFATGQTSLADMAGVDAASEAEAVALYTAAVKQADEAGDITTRKLLEDILGDEEGHLDTFNKMLGK